MTRASGTEGYGETADVLAERYETLRFEDVHRETLHLIPAKPVTILDVGAGTGRDAAALVARGHSVTAVEPTPELRAHGQRLHADANIVWIDDSLPHLARVAGTFDLVLLTAVWMHLDESQRAHAMPAIARLMKPGTLAILSLRHGPVPKGRRMFDISAAETSALAERHGLATVHSSERPAMAHNSPDVWWSVLAFRRQ